MRRNTVQVLDCVSVGKARLGRVHSLGPDPLNHVGGLWPIGVGSSYLLSGPGLI